MIKKRDMIVTTYTGLKKRKSQCKNIKNNYYFVGDPTIKNSGECYLVDGKYHRFNNGYIEYDHSQNSYVLVHKTTLKDGIVEFDENGNEFIMGMFSPQITENVIITDTDNISQVCISEDIAKKAKFREQLTTGIFFKRTQHTTPWFNKIGKSPLNKGNLDYESRFSSSLTKDTHEKTFFPEENSHQLNILGDFLSKHGITFGVEFETTLGYIPERLCYKYGLIPLRDGSIEGIEYVTVPLSGRKGLYALKEICKEMNKRTKHDYSCALHLHLGGIKRSESSILSSFILACLVQDESFLLQPRYKSGGSNTQSKDFCKPFPTNNIFGKLPSLITKPEEITKWFTKLFKFISDGREYSNYKYSLDSVDTHPSDPTGTRKWEIKSRYFWINYVPLVFGNKKTIEFRNHNITNDFEKIINFLFGCSVFVWTTQNCETDLFNEKSELYKNLIRQPHDSMGILMRNFMQKGHENMSTIVFRYMTYIGIRKEVMRCLSDKEDLVAAGEKRLDYKYNALTQDFWE